MKRSQTQVITTGSAKISFKNNSAISARGYDSKLSLWGTVLASLLIGCMRRYIQRTGETGHIIDGVAIARSYSKIVGELYARVKFTELPAVQSHEVALLSKVFSRTDKNEVPESTAQTWCDISKTTDGGSCMSVIESLITAAKMVPEAMLHPISSIFGNWQHCSITFQISHDAFLCCRCADAMTK